MLLFRVILLGVLLVAPLLANNFHISDFNATFDGPPDVFLFGVQKGGTTALAEVLVRLKVCTYLKRNVKEPQLFSYEFNDKAFNRYVNGFNRMKQSNSTRLTLDASPNYFSELQAFSNIQTLYSRESLVKKKYIIMLRDPVARLFSWYRHIYGHCSSYYRKKWYPGFSKGALVYCVPPKQKNTYHDNFHDYLQRKHLFTEFGHYLPDLKRWLQIIPRKQLLILNSQALAGNNQSQTIDIVLDFLGYSYLKTGHYQCSLQNKQWTHCKGRF